MFDGIEVRGAREHNLKNISVKIPRNKITVVTGLSGSGKSSLAFDTIYAEGQRRYIESLSAYARQFMEQLKKPEVDAILGLSPSIAIDQKTINTNPRSTVGTVTEIYDYLRLLFARVGTPYCPVHKRPVSSQLPEQIVQSVMELPRGTRFLVLAPVARQQKGEFVKDFERWSKRGLVWARVDGKWVELAQAPKLNKRKPHDIDILIDRLLVEESYRGRLQESIQLSLELTDGLVVIESKEGKISKLYSLRNACPECGYSFPEMEPRMFSFNHPRGACEACNGIGYHWVEGEEEEDLREVCEVCQGQRLKESVLNVFVGEKNISEVSKQNAQELIEFLEGLNLKGRQALLSEKIIQQLLSRLHYLQQVGAGYLSMDRPSRTLSGGEMQRIRLATQLGSSLVGVLYVLDEPSIGLHPSDHQRLLKVLKSIQERGNTVLLVEHDEDTIELADHIIDLGPGAGRLGGDVVAQGSLGDIKENKKSLTGLFLSGHRNIPSPQKRRPGNGEYLEIQGASGHNLKNIDVRIPLGTLCGVTGVSGSGKSTLIIETLYRELSRRLYGSLKEPEDFRSLSGEKYIDKIVEVNQKPIGRTPRSIPATYVGLMTHLRSLFAQLPESKMRGYRPGYFSFNIKGGRCEVCQGAGEVKLEMHFLSDAYVPCEACQGMRYHAEAQKIRFKGKSIADVLRMSVEEAKDFFRSHRSIYEKLKTLSLVGLDYIHLGQSSTTLSGGEAQRVKLSKELSKRSTGKTLYILDEPTTGLHLEDIKKLIELLHLLVDRGNTVIVIEHNMHVIKNCDWVIDLGPGGGKDGGHLVAAGIPEQVSQIKSSITGQVLKKYLPNP